MAQAAAGRLAAAERRSASPGAARLAAAQQAAAERAQYEMQQRQLEQANALESSKVLDSVVKIETGAGTDVADDSTALGVKKKKASTSTSLGVV